MVTKPSLPPKALEHLTPEEVRELEAYAREFGTRQFSWETLTRINNLRDKCELAMGDWFAYTDDWDAFLENQEAFLGRKAMHLKICYTSLQQAVRHG